jgi:hypothetical protein
MDDRELREVLRDVIADLDDGRAEPRPRRRIRCWLGPPFVVGALAFGLITGCDEGAHPGQDAFVQLDSGAVDAYGIPADGEAVADAGVDAEVDGMILPPYSAPPLDDFPFPA